MGWLGLSVRDLRAVAQWRELPSALPAAPPRVTAVVAGRDDAGPMVAAVQGLLAQTGVQLAVHAVDDRSGDGTAAALAALAQGEPRLVVRSVRELPAGWLGKVHALHVGAADAAGDWLLFVDADSRLQPDTVARAVAAAEQTGADHFVLMPAHERPTFWGKASVLAFHQVVQARLAAVNGARQRTSVGTGAFSLVRAAAYRAVGGHLPLRLEVVDDVGLGTLLFRAGFRSRACYAGAAVRTEWGRSARGLLQVVEKNMFAILGYRTWLVALLVAGALLLLLATALLPCVGTTVALLAPAAYLFTALPPAWIARRLGWSPWFGVLVLGTRLLLPWALLRSTLLTLWRGGVLWRGTHYPLAALRAGRVR